ncbi:MAG: hypothetical protein JWM10_352 [Myxococcaceae bacterium]|nr:hypothetical protein [Myxococcaceae bacterium]
MIARGCRTLRDVHRLASRYHWSEEAILRMALSRRSAYLALLDAEEDRGLFSALGAREG